MTNQEDHLFNVDTCCNIVYMVKRFKFTQLLRLHVTVNIVNKSNKLGADKYTCLPGACLAYPTCQGSPVLLQR
jgi:hypothetical protein